MFKTENSRNIINYAFSFSDGNNLITSKLLLNRQLLCSMLNWLSTFKIDNCCALCWIGYTTGLIFLGTISHHYKYCRHWLTVSLLVIYMVKYLVYTWYHKMVWWSKNYNLMGKCQALWFIIRQSICDGKELTWNE